MERRIDGNGNTIYTATISNRRLYMIRKDNNDVFRPWKVELRIEGKNGKFVDGTKKIRTILLCETHCLKDARAMVNNYLANNWDKLY